MKELSINSHSHSCDWTPVICSLHPLSQGLSHRSLTWNRKRGKQTNADEMHSDRLPVNGSLSGSLQGIKRGFYDADDEKVFCARLISLTWTVKAVASGCAWLVFYDTLTWHVCAEQVTMSRTKNQSSFTFITVISVQLPITEENVELYLYTGNTVEAIFLLSTYLSMWDNKNQS